MFYRIKKLMITVGLLSIASIAMAGTINPPVVYQKKRVYHPQTHHQDVFEVDHGNDYLGIHHAPIVLEPKFPPKHVKPTMSILINPGSLRTNIERVTHQFGWRHVVWDVPYDFTFVGSVRIRSNSSPHAMASLLKNYPLQAVFYRGNRVVVIKPRALK